MTSTPTAMDIKRLGREAGFDLVGIAPAEPLADFEHYRQWLDRGYHGTMRYLAREADTRRDPRMLAPEARSVIVCAMSYLTTHPFRGDSEKHDRPLISRYAWGRDYHKILRKRLKRLLLTIEQRAGRPVRACVCVDTARLLERSLAARAGIGWIGKNSALIHPKLGSFLFLGELLVDLELEPDEPIRDRCGTCERCLEACPTNALIKPQLVDARRCISYLTIEHRGEIESALAGRVGSRVFGCDVCQDVCPWNRKAHQRSAPGIDEWGPRPELTNAQFADLTFENKEAFRDFFRGTPVLRTRWKGWRRNFAVALRNALSDSLSANRSQLVELLQRFEAAGGAGLDDSERRGRRNKVV